uniref:Uncharacterized protein n=1 Tax=Timema douglasi TaxID=61478 RepID=A0A7R8Z4T3_TIMDO|nr:unnamed protein product [Timema douglasi]
MEHERGEFGVNGIYGNSSFENVTASFHVDYLGKLPSPGDLYFSSLTWNSYRTDMEYSLPVCSPESERQRSSEPLHHDPDRLLPSQLVGPILDPQACQELLESASEIPQTHHRNSGSTLHASTGGLVLKESLHVHGITRDIDMHEGAGTDQHADAQGCITGCPGGSSGSWRGPDDFTLTICAHLATACTTPGVGAAPLALALTAGLFHIERASAAKALAFGHLVDHFLPGTSSFLTGVFFSLHKRKPSTHPAKTGCTNLPLKADPLTLATNFFLLGAGCFLCPGFFNASSSGILPTLTPTTFFTFTVGSIQTLLRVPFLIMFLVTSCFFFSLLGIIDRIIKYAVISETILMIYIGEYKLYSVGRRMSKSGYESVFHCSTVSPFGIPIAEIPIVRGSVSILELRMKRGGYAFVSERIAGARVLPHEIKGDCLPRLMRLSRPEWFFTLWWFKFPTSEEQAVFNVGVYVPVDPRPGITLAFQYGLTEEKRKSWEIYVKEELQQGPWDIPFSISSGKIRALAMMSTLKSDYISITTGWKETAEFLMDTLLPGDEKEGETKEQK